MVAALLFQHFAKQSLQINIDGPKDGGVTDQSMEVCRTKVWRCVGPKDAGVTDQRMQV